MSNPTHKRGGLFDATFGSFGMKREFIRYNSGDIGNSGVQGTDYLETKGKTQVQSPKVQAALGLDYDDGHFFAGAQMKYVGKQYSTMMNDNSIPQFITDNLDFGYRFGSIGFMQTPKIQVNLSNLTNARFRSGVYTMQTNATTGVNGSTIKGSSPAYYLQAPFTCIVTISTNF